ncbi:hypothetical protein [Nocardia asteroides]|uniref:hypothetical protein n=1 Tax=Nocardia asteroides TaxID=1824 RepID=UPI00340376E4
MPREGISLGTKTTWWNEIPHIGHLLSPLVDLHRAESARGMRRRAAEVGDACVRDSAFGHMLREALDGRRIIELPWSSETLGQRSSIVEGVFRLADVQRGR